MYKTPHRFIARVNDAGEYSPMLVDALKSVADYGMDKNSVGSVLITFWQGSYWVTTYYWMTDKREAEFDAARNGFPFIASEDDISMKVGLLARLYRAIIA